MLKHQTIVTVLDPAMFITETTHPTFKVFEPMHFAGGNLPEENSNAMVVAKTYLPGGGLFYLLTNPSNQQFIAPANAIEKAPSATKLEYLQWFYNAFSGNVPDASQQFAVITGKNAPDLGEEKPEMSLEQETAVALEEAAEAVEPAEAEAEAEAEDNAVPAE